MSTVPALQRMRIIALPLTRPNLRIPPLARDKLNRLTYYQFQLPEPTQLHSTTLHTGGESGDGMSDRNRKKNWLPQEGVANWATQKATNMWTQFGKADGGWKLRVYQLGQKLVDRTEFEELALKSFDPSMGPSITRLKRSPVLDEKTQRAIPLVYPPSELSPSTSLSELRAYVESRIPRHRNGFYLWLFIMPFTFPLKLIPIIPNLPFFFCAWRSWSHYRAYKSSQYLHSLLEHDLITPEASEDLDEIYKMQQTPLPSTTRSSPTTLLSTNGEPRSSSDSVSEHDDSKPQHTLLLNRDAVPKIRSLFPFESESTAATDLYRAIEQARVRISAGHL